MFWLSKLASNGESGKASNPLFLTKSLFILICIENSYQMKLKITEEMQ